MVETMKDSGIKWLGEIPKGWNVDRTKFHYRNVKQVAGIKSEEYERLALTLNGVIKRPKDDADGLQPGDFDSYQVLKKGDLVFKLIDLQNVSTSRVGLSDYVGIVSPAYIRLEPKDNNSSRYGEYYFLSMWQREIFNQLGDAGVRSNLSSTDLLEIPYLSLPLSEQELIADFLDEKCAEIDKLSEDIQKQIDILNDYKNTIISRATTQGIRKERKFKDSGVNWCRLIPEEWEQCSPKVLFSQRNDRIKNDDEQLTSSQEYGIISQAKYMKVTGNKVVTVAKDFSILKHVEPGDFVISMRSFQGGLEYSEVRGCISSAYVMLIPNRQFVVPKFYRWFLKSGRYINAIQSTSNLIRDGQAMRYANFVQIKLFKIPFDEQNEIADYLDKECAFVDSAIQAKTAQLKKLFCYKKSIIYEYVTGKKRVV